MDDHDDTDLDDNVIDLDDTEEELVHLKKNRDATQSVFNM